MILYSSVTGCKCAAFSETEHFECVKQRLVVSVENAMQIGRSLNGQAKDFPCKVLPTVCSDVVTL